jgi:secreted protein with Ig-like and vWFA domain
MAFNAGGTNIGGGISTGMSTLASTGARPWAVRVIILLTDGINNWGPDPRTEASSAASQGVMIYTISFADEADQALMQDIANIGYGRHYHAQNSADLTNAFRDIARHLPMLLTK